jgi:hypothetical protein
MRKPHQRRNGRFGKLPDLLAGLFLAWRIKANFKFTYRGVTSRQIVSLVNEGLKPQWITLPLMRMDESIKTIGVSADIIHALDGLFNGGCGFRHWL